MKIKQIQKLNWSAIDPLSKWIIYIALNASDHYFCYSNTWTIYIETS